MIIEPPEASVIIPYFNRWDLTHARMAELYRFLPDNCEIVLIDDCSTETEAAKGVAWWQKNPQRHRVRYYKNKENIGFGGSCNIGARLANGRVLIFLSNDVVVYEDVFSDIICMIGLDDTMLLAGRVVDFPGGWNEFDAGGKHIVIPYAEGWLIGCTKKAWKTLGGFDLRYGKYGYEDVDLSTTAIEKKFSIVGLNSHKVHHLVGRTIASLGVDRMAVTVNNREVYLQKWQDKLATLEV